MVDLGVRRQWNFLTELNARDSLQIVLTANYREIIYYIVNAWRFFLKFFDLQLHWAFLVLYWKSLLHLFIPAVLQRIALLFCSI